MCPTSESNSRLLAGKWRDESSKLLFLFPHSLISNAKSPLLTNKTHLAHLYTTTYTHTTALHITTRLACHVKGRQLKGSCRGPEG